MANPNLLSAHTTEAEWHPASQTAELQKTAEQDRTLPETRARRFGTLALRFLKRQNNTAETPLVEGSAAELAERNRRNKESSDRAVAELDAQVEADRRGEQPEVEPVSTDSWDYGEGTTPKTEVDPADAKGWDYGEGTPKPEAVPVSTEGWDYGEGTPKPEANYPGLDPNLYTNGGTAAEKQAWTETHPGWKSE